MTPFISGVNSSGKVDISLGTPVVTTGCQGYDSIRRPCVYFGTGNVVSGGAAYTSDGRLCVYDATSGVPAGSVNVGGYVFTSDGRLCVASGTPVAIVNGLGVNSSGAVCTQSAFIYDFLASADPVFGGGTTTKSISANETYTNSAGLITQGTANVWPLDYSPSTLLPLGRRVEEARTNLLLNSLLNGTNLSTQSVTLPASAHTLSFYGTGTITLSGASTAGPLVGTGAYPNQVSLTFTPSAGSVTFTVTGTVQYAQLEAGSFATSFIPTAGASVTRAADALSIATGAWFNASEGTIVVEFICSNLSAARNVSSLNDGTTSEQATLYYTTTSGGFSVVDGGASQANIVAGAISANSIAKTAAAYAVNNINQATNGSLGTLDTSATLPTVTTLQLGNAPNNLYLNGWLRKLYYYPTRESNARLTELST